MPSLKSKVVWGEGLFLRPQHLQQNNRYLEHLVESRYSDAITLPWGLTELQVDSDLLGLGKLAIVQAAGVFPDGTPFNIPDDATTPMPLVLTEALQNQVVYLGLPLKRAESMETAASEADATTSRFSGVDIDVQDNTSANPATTPVLVGEPRLRLLTAQDDRSTYTCIGIARVQEVRPEAGALLDSKYIPSFLNGSNCQPLRSVIAETAGKLQERATNIISRIGDANVGGTSALSDFLMLQVVNRYLPTIGHMQNLSVVHPERVYSCFLEIAGELSTFTHPNKRPPAFPTYNHEDLEASFAPLMLELRRSLSTVTEQKAIALPLEEKDYGVYVSPIADRNLLSSAHFVLAAKADVPSETIQTQFPKQIKIAPVENIREFVLRQIPGISVQVLGVAPPEIPFHSGNIYFELNQHNEYWSQLESSAALALHISGQFPGLKLELWAIRN